MPKCQKCGKEVSLDHKFCFSCGHHLKKPYNKPDEKPIFEALPKCFKCETDLGDKYMKMLVCPYCGQYLGFNVHIIHPKLVELAISSPLGDSGFLTNFLGLPTRTAHALARRGVSALKALSLRESDIMWLRNFGEKSYKELDRARNNWTPKEK